VLSCGKGICARQTFYANRAPGKLMLEQKEDFQQKARDKRMTYKCAFECKKEN